MEEKFSKETLETAKGLRLIDDTLFRLIGARPEVCQEILRTLLDDAELIVLDVRPQETIVSLHREISLDVLCKTKDGRLINVEVQKGNRNDDIRRCRFHLSSVTANRTPKGTDFADIPDVVIVYITEYDALGNGQSVTCSEMCQMVDGKYVPVNDGAKIYYANPVGKDNSDKRELLNLFLQKDSFENQKFPELSQAMKYFKEDERGVQVVCTLVEDYAKKVAEKAEKEMAIKYARCLISLNKDTEEIAKETHLSEEEVEELRK
ncbi:MAG: PD-(D/E)XK nuclease family transposase [Lachnospiraceae bacterium]